MAKVLLAEVALCRSYHHDHAIKLASHLATFELVELSKGLILGPKKTWFWLCLAPLSFGIVSRQLVLSQIQGEPTYIMWGSKSMWDISMFIPMSRTSGHFCSINSHKHSTFCMPASSSTTLQEYVQHNH